VEPLTETGHLLMEERPDDLARIVIDFLVGGTPAPTGADTRDERHDHGAVSGRSTDHAARRV